MTWSKEKVSEMRLDLMRRSRGVSQVKEGEWFTSNSHGRSFASSMTSKPSTSKHVNPSLLSEGKHDLYVWASAG